MHLTAKNRKAVWLLVFIVLNACLLFIGGSTLYLIQQSAVTLSRTEVEKIIFGADHDRLINIALMGDSSLRSAEHICEMLSWALIFAGLLNFGFVVLWLGRKPKVNSTSQP